ncbi:MAG: RNA-binding protein [Candidatus Eremiobacteraeota bacterium]|nr:RNA-binding protein [Candidatus Eremiobacteraeota bacterium]
MIRLFVAGYPRDASLEDLVALFKQFGADESAVTFPRDRRTRRKKGYAYVNVADDGMADTAIGTLNDFEIEGKPLTVIRAADRPAKRPRRRY